MEEQTNHGTFATVALVAAMSLLSSGPSRAHCDTMAGPVIPEARAALESGDVTPTLKWVQKGEEGEIREAFAQTIAVRGQSPAAKELADRYFLETLIRLHRAGEGAPYTGLKDEPVEPIAAMADRALAEGSAEAMLRAISGHMSAAIAEKFQAVAEAKKTKDTSVEAGRRYVAAYVTYVHFVEVVHDAIVADGAHAHAGAASPAHEH